MRSLVSGARSELVIIVLAWIALAIAAWPLGDFPLNDDWSYSRSVEILVHEGRFDLVYAAVPLVTQVAWGTLVTVPFGFSFAALRAATWVLGLVGLVAMFALLRSLRPTPRLALFGTLLLAANPFYLSLALTFMTDIPFLGLALACIAVVAGATGLRPRPRLVAGAALLVATLLVRQPAVAIALGWGAAIVLARGISGRSLLLGAMPALACFAILTGYEFIVRRTVGLPVLYGHPYDSIAPMFAAGFTAGLSELVHRLALILLTVGLFTLPVSILVTASLWRAFPRPGRIWAIGVVVFAAGIGATFWAAGQVVPLGNVVYDVGVGPPLLRDVYLLGLRHLPSATAVLWLAVAVAAFVGIALLLWLVAGVAWNGRGHRLGEIPRGVIVPLVTAVALAGFLGVTGLLDRYLLPVIALATVPVAAAAATSPSRRWWSLSVAFLVCMTAFSVAGTHDYFAWNRARWQALTDLTQGRGVPPAQIDGGLEFHGWVKYSADEGEDPVLGWSTGTANYVVAFGPIDGYGEIARYSYDRWLPPGTGEVIVLQRAEAP